MQAFDTTKRYAAFISYRHVSPDLEIAHALHHLLEHNQVRPDRRAPRNIRPVFMDTKELPLMADLGDGIKFALENSDCLIVICSPDLPLSRYCMQEIDYFKQLHGGNMDRVFTLLVRGGPEESFPPNLLTTTRIQRDEEGNETIVTVPREPLFADVRGQTLQESLKKLRKKEYLRIAAGYYGCSFDGLYKRRRRWLIKVASLCVAGVLALGAGFAGYAALRNRQYALSAADACAVQAENSMANGDTKLALALLGEGREAGFASGSAHYERTLRSALVRDTLGPAALPVALSYRHPSDNRTNPVLYISRDGASLLCVSDYLVTVLDARTGGVVNRFTADNLYVDADDISLYAAVDAARDENGQYQDRFTLCRLDGTVLNTFFFRPTEQGGQYKLNSYPDIPGLYSLTDNNQLLFYLDAQGQQLSPAQVLERYGAAPEETESAPPFTVVGGNRVLRKPAVVKDRAQNTVLTLEDASPRYVFSSDYRCFALIREDLFTFYDTDTWQPCGELTVENAPLLDAALLRDSRYLLCVWRTGDNWSRSVLYDRQTGEALLTMDGYAYPDEGNRCLYVMERDCIARYTYRDLDTRSPMRVAAVRDGIAATEAFLSAGLADTAAGEQLCREELTSFAQASYARDLSRALLPCNRSLKCVDGQGRLLWEQEMSFPSGALSADGRLAAYEDAQGNVQVVNAADNSPLYTVPTGLPGLPESIGNLAVDEQGLFMGGDPAVWLPAGSNSPIPLGDYDHADLSLPGHLLLSSSTAYVQDLALWSMESRNVVWQPEDNSGQTVLGGGYLVRHREQTGNHTTFEIEVLHWEKGAPVSKGVLTLPEKNILAMQTDSSGQWLSINTDSHSLLYRLDTLQLVLDTVDMPVFYEDGRLWSLYAYAGVCPSMPYPEAQQLSPLLEEALTGAYGLRELTDEEKVRYSTAK